MQKAKEMKLLNNDNIDNSNNIRPKGD